LTPDLPASPAAPDRLPDPPDIGGTPDIFYLGASPVPSCGATQARYIAYVDPARTGGVGVAFTSRHGGVSAPPFDSFTLGQAGGADPAQVRENLELVQSDLGLRALVGVHQVHGTKIVPVHTGIGVTPAYMEGDGLVTQAPGLGLLIKAADCVPVMLGDAAAGVVAAAHAGRVGLLAGVLPAAVAALRQRGAQQITAWIGPHVCGLCYEVPADMAEAAWRQLPATQATSRRGTPAIDLGAGAAAQLQDLGCHVVRLDPCTVESPDLFSYRRDAERSGRQGGIVWLA
jgi:YfiH family protein